MRRVLRELWLTGWKGKKGGLHTSKSETERERERERFSVEYGQHDRHKGSSLAMGLQYFCYGTLNSYEFSNATTAVNNGESARNKGGKTRGMGERNTFLLPPPPPRPGYFSSSYPLEFGRFLQPIDRSFDRSFDFCRLSCEETFSLQEEGNQIARQ